MSDNEHWGALAREVEVAYQLSGQGGGGAGLEVALQLHQRPGRRLRDAFRPEGRGEGGTQLGLADWIVTLTF